MGYPERLFVLDVGFSRFLCMYEVKFKKNVLRNLTREVAGFTN